MKYLGCDNVCELVDWLLGPEACNFREDDDGQVRWTCHHDLRFTEQWLAENGFDVVQGLDFCHHTGGYCDCEVIFNTAEYCDCEEIIDES